LQDAAARAQATLSGTPDLAELWTDFAQLAQRYHHFPTLDTELVRSQLDVTMLQGRRDLFRRQTNDFVRRTQHYADIWLEDQLVTAISS